MGGTHASREPEARGGAVVSFCDQRGSAQRAWQRGLWLRMLRNTPAGALCILSKYDYVIHEYCFYILHIITTTFQKGELKNVFYENKFPLKKKNNIAHFSYYILR